MGRAIIAPVLHQRWFSTGNSDFYGLYGYIKENLGFPDGHYPIYIHGSDSSKDAWVNFMHFYRIQINCPIAQFQNGSSSDYYTMALAKCRYSSFDGLDLEGVDGNKLRMESCKNVGFENAYMWSQPNNLFVNITSNNEGNVFIGCRITMGTILDICATDMWIGCTIDGTIHQDSKAYFYYPQQP